MNAFSLPTTGELVPSMPEPAFQAPNHFQTLFDLSPVAVYTIDAAGVVQQFNRVAAELWGRSPQPGDTDEVFCGSHRMFLPDGTFMAHRDCPMATVLHGDVDEARDAEVIIERPDGSRINVIVNIRPLTDMSGRTVGAINCFYDITERKRLELKAAQQARDLIDLHERKDEFLAMLSHELRGPLAPIFSAVQVLQRTAPDDAKRTRLQDIIANSARQLKRLVDDLMDMSRITHGKIRLQLQPTRFAEVVERAVDTVRPLAEASGIEFRVALAIEPMLLDADQSRLEQVVVNLLTNAVKYTARGGRVCLATSREGDVAILRISDTGVGISPALLPHVFDLFSQAETSSDRSGGGLGIGLCLVRRLVELHGGQVSVTSELDVGSEFIVRLPTMLAMPAPHPPAIDRQDRSEGQRVLVVDDSVDAATTLGELMASSGFSVRIAHDGLAALKAVTAFAPEIVFLDIGLPLVNGHDVALAIRRDPSIAQPVLIAITGYGGDDDRSDSTEAGFDHHLIKPVDFDELTAIVSDIQLARRAMVGAIDAGEVASTDRDS